MISETFKQQLVQNIYDNVDFRYPETSGASQYDFNSGNQKFIYRMGEPYEMQYPALKVQFLPRIDMVVGGLNNVIDHQTGTFIYGYGELEPVIFTIYTHQQCKGNSNNSYHGKIVANAYIRRIEKHVRRYWPKILWASGASIRESMGFEMRDISAFLAGTERQGFEMTMYLVTPNTWDFVESDDLTDVYFIDATLSGCQSGFENIEGYDIEFSVSGNQT